ncbi:MAG: hypothetical protein WCI04_06870 [archaeon]
MDANEIAAVVSNADCFSMERKLVFKSNNSIKGGYLLEVTLILNNSCNKEFSNIVLLEAPISKKLAQDVSKINSDVSFNTILADPIISFNITRLDSNTQKIINYSINLSSKLDLNLINSETAGSNKIEFGAPIVIFADVVTDWDNDVPVVSDSNSTDSSQVNVDIIKSSDYDDGLWVLIVVIVVIFLVIVISTSRHGRVNSHKLKRDRL